jgi:hypothetical protein
MSVTNVAIEVSKEGILAFPMSRIGEEIIVKGRVETGAREQLGSRKVRKELGFLVLSTGKRMPWKSANQIGWN